MKKHKLIDEMVFSIMVNSKHRNESKATFGGYDLDKYAMKGAELEWHNINNKFSFWLLELTNMTLSNSLNPKAEKEYVFGTKSLVNYMIVDSGTSFLLMPSNELKLL